MSNVKKKQVKAERKVDPAAAPVPIGNTLNEVFTAMGAERNFAKYGKTKKKSGKERVFADSKGTFSEMNKSRGKKRRLAE